MIDDTTLRHRIATFYEKISDYNDLVKKVNRKLSDLIRTHASKIYSKKVYELRYWVVKKDGEHTSPETLSCLTWNIHPLKVHDNSTPLQVDVKFRKSGNDLNEVIKSGSPEFDKFDEFWDAVSTIIASDSDILKLRTLFKEIGIDNKKLQKKYSEQIELLWKV